METLEFYKQQSRITDPKQRAHLYDSLSDDIAGIGQVVRGLVTHYFAGEFEPTPERLPEVDCRHVPLMLDAILGHDDSPLDMPRSAEQRMVGCCRDFATLTVSILRHKGIPARVRYGTATYLQPGYNVDHVIIEHWNGERWIMTDTELSPDSEWPGVNVMDLNDDQFVPGGKGWLQARSGAVPAEKFGLGTVREVDHWAFLRQELVLDLAGLNRMEMLCWDCWGFNEQQTITEDDLKFLDHVAEEMRKPGNFEGWRKLYEHPQLKPTTQMISFSPAADPMSYPLRIEVTL